MKNKKIEKISRDIMIINSIYMYPQKINNEWYSDCLLLVIKENNEKKILTLNRPTFSYYVTKKEHFNDKEFKKYLSLLYIEEEKTEKVSCEYNQLLYSILEHLPENEQIFYKRQLENSSNKKGILNNIHKSKYVHGSDMDIEDYYYYKIQKKYGVSNQKIDKAFLDIEVNSSEFKKFVSENDAYAPISHIGLFFNGTFYQFILKFNKIKESKNLNEDIIKEYKKELIERHSKYGMNDVQIFLFNEEDELKMIKAYFDLINELKPDIICAWNLKFDIQYLLNRISYLKKVPFEDYESNYSEFGGNSKRYKFSKEARNFIIPKELRSFNYVMYSKDVIAKDYADDSSYFKYAGYSVYIDMMLVYANMTKSEKKESYSLDFIAEYELNDRKDILGGEEDEGISMSDVITKYYKDFTMYNAHDVMLIKRIDEKTMYQEILWGVSQITGTRIYKAMKKTTCLKNFAKIKLEEIGIILSNNRNSKYSNKQQNKKEVTEEETDILLNTNDDSLTGAFVADPQLLDNVGSEIFENVKSNKIFDTVIDEDLVSMYPKIINTFNIDPALQLGMLYFYNTKDTNYSILEFISLFISNDWIEMGKRYFNLPNIEDILNKLKL